MIGAARLGAGKTESQGDDVPEADLILDNARIRTLDEARPSAEAVRAP